MTFPILILQMQRMGDLLLSFPCIIDLQKKYPDHPVWVVAEEEFFTPLLPLAPKVTFFAPESLEKLKKEQFHMVLNLSSHPEAAAFMESVQAEKKIGALDGKAGLQVLGFWQLYRHSLTQNNRHNTFHWADLFRLDLCPSLGDYPSRLIRIRPCQNRRLAMVLGASTREKHPSSAFWIRLSERFLKKGIAPFFLGGKKEAELGDYVARRLHFPNLNLCGKLSLFEGAQFLKGCDLCISPDTGPMHLANWLGIQVLNLSMGNVRAHETGPYGLHQYVLSAALSCAGCWQCNDRNLLCKKKFTADHVADLALKILEQKEISSPPNLLLSQTNMDANHLFLLDSPPRNAQSLLDAFWRNIFLTLAFHEVHDEKKWAKRLSESFPGLFFRLQKTLLSLIPLFTKDHALPPDFGLRTLPALRLFTGFLDMSIQNANHHPSAYATCARWIAYVMETLRP